MMGDTFDQYDPRPAPQYAPSVASGSPTPVRYAPPVEAYASGPQAYRSNVSVQPHAAHPRYAPPAYPVPIYASPYQTYMRPVAPPTSLSVTALVLGIASAVVGWIFFVVPIVGLVFSIIALRREPAGRSLAIGGLVGSAIGILWVLFAYVAPLIITVAGLAAAVLTQ